MTSVRGTSSVLQLWGDLRPLNVLDNLDVKAPSKGIVLEKRLLVRLNQQGEGSDPFKRFEEGLDPANKNPLRVTNVGGKLAIELGAANYIDGKRDGKWVTTIKPLEFTDAVQRYHIVEKNGAELGDELIINVNRIDKEARVWMRVTKNGKRTEWEQIADYATKES